MKHVDLVIVGGGSAGLAAAISAYDQGIKDILIIEKGPTLGGILNQCIHNGFGIETFNEQLTGPEYAERFIDEVDKRHIAYKLNTMVVSLNANKDLAYSNDCEGYQVIEAGALIMATGCYERSAGQIMLPGARLAGVMTAGQAQEYVNIDGYMVGRNVFILGSGDIGLIMARRMALEGANVLGVAEIMPYSNGLPRNIVQCLNDFDIPLFLSHTISNVYGRQRVEKITITEVDDQFNFIAGSEKDFVVDTLLLSVGLVPNNDLLMQAGAELSSTKGPIVDEKLETTIPGIFSCGNALHVHDIVDYVSDEGKLAGISAAQYLLNPHFENGAQIRVLPGNLIGYVVPQRIDINSNAEEIILKYRVKKPIEKARISVQIDGVEIKKAFRPFAIPSEMEMIKLRKQDLRAGSLLTVEVNSHE
ncbi:MAG: FAD-dependent oxidoreductase [Bacilli bacterium]|jgi:NADPH-dependent 2,4-dienoyl-CoA reductase/sulfur reductase-like enzyme|nr:FAD-dependent oxidoreductase [Bacilli bacterium]MDD3388916.1 FAD-dependent oxidoreductase [Bacilli bacterium]MDD4344630.1 FAD-dependent oxidoreductase [Bacilli bacterium]MDD4520596.1 FAD-dependent oxidoreductase [Bacilli bacterium]MDY0399288.1 FAD-dependent oxidoreductase [Bacilli bacterium]